MPAGRGPLSRGGPRGGVVQWPGLLLVQAGSSLASLLPSPGPSMLQITPLSSPRAPAPHPERAHLGIAFFQGLCFPLIPEFPHLVHVVSNLCQGSYKN